MLDRTEIHVHYDWSNFRLIDAINKIDKVAKYAQEIGLKAISVTDHGTVAGHMTANILQQEIQKTNPDFKIILGEEGYLVDERGPQEKYYHCIWLAKDKKGQEQIRKFSSTANLNSFFDRGMERVPITKNEIENIIGNEKGHVIVSTACLAGEVATNILLMESARKNGFKDQELKAYQNINNFINWAKKIFNDDFYLEVAPSADPDQIIVNKKMIDIAKAYNLKVIIGCDAHYLKASDRYVHAAFLNSKSSGDRETDSFYKYAYLQTEEEILENLAPSIADYYPWMCENSMEIYNKIENYSLLHTQQIPKVEVDEFPIQKINLGEDYPVLNEMFSSENKVERYWINKCYNKLIELNKNEKNYLAELEEEAEVKRIVGKRLDTNMFMYPILLSHYIDLIWECGSTVGAGRGSACSALNHYLLGITQLDSVEWAFPFFRYMNRDTEGLGSL